MQLLFPGLDQEIATLLEQIDAISEAHENQLLRREELESTIASQRNQIFAIEEMLELQKTKINDKNREIEDAEAQMKAFDDVMIMRPRYNSLDIYSLSYNTLPSSSSRLPLRQCSVIPISPLIYIFV